MQTEQSDRWYLDNEKSVRDITPEVLRGVDHDVDFSRYDNWTGDGSQFNLFVEPRPDGYVDMVFVVYRRVAVPSPYELKFFGAGNAALYVEPLYTDDGVAIVSESGVQQHQSADHVYEWSKTVSVHEYAHHLFGGHDDFPKWVPQPGQEDEARMRLK
ncbi:MAG: hypothetical protein HYX75_00115 [Acidobacteria bacterium]|nr:hypothetical protein [Acidobacteriota bacterium]